MIMKFGKIDKNEIACYLTPLPAPKLLKYETTETVWYA